MTLELWDACFFVMLLVVHYGVIMAIKKIAKIK